MSSIASAPKVATKYIIGLDLVRFSAALLVLSYHLGFWIRMDSYGVAVSYTWPTYFSWFGFVGVEIFFTLSGFVIAYSSRNATSLSFTRSRVSRLLPGTLICASLTALALLLSQSQAWTRVLSEWLRSAFLPLHGPYVDGAYWTLPIEIIFYCLVLAVIAFNAGRGLSRVVGFMGVCSAAAWLILLPVYFFGNHFGAARISSGAGTLMYLMSTRPALFFTLLPHGCFFAEGVFLWLCLLNRATPRRLVVVVICALGGLGETFWHTGLQIASSLGAERVPFSFNKAEPCVIWLISVVLICASVKGNAWFSNKLGGISGWVRWAGLMTYPLYLLHQRIGYLLIESLRSKLGDSVSLLISTTLIFALALLVAMFGEPPLRNTISGLLGGSTRK